MICRHKLYHFTVANTRFTAPLTRRGKSKFATIKWYNLCLQIIQSQTCYPLITQRFRTDLGRSVGVTEVTPLVWLNGFYGRQPFHSPQRQCNQTDTTRQKYWLQYKQTFIKIDIFAEYNRKEYETLQCIIAIIDQCLYIHTHLWYRKNPTAILVFALLILINVSLNTGRHRFLLIQFEYQSILWLFRSFFLVRQHINILFINKSDELIRGIPDLFLSWDVCSLNAVLIKYVRDRLFCKAHDNWRLRIQCGIFL